MRLGGTCWRLEQLELALEGAFFLPVAQLNKLRRDLVEARPQLILASATPRANWRRIGLISQSYCRVFPALVWAGLRIRNRRWLCLCAALSNCEPCAINQWRH